LVKENGDGKRRSKSKMAGVRGRDQGRDGEMAAGESAGDVSRD
jgi:hypothetical protein